MQGLVRRFQCNSQKKSDENVIFRELMFSAFADRALHFSRDGSALLCWCGVRIPSSVPRWVTTANHPRSGVAQGGAVSSAIWARSRPPRESRDSFVDFLVRVLRSSLPPERGGGVDGKKNSEHCAVTKKNYCRRHEFPAEVDGPQWYCGWFSRFEVRCLSVPCGLAANKNSLLEGGVGTARGGPREWPALSISGRRTHGTQAAAHPCPV